MTFHGKERFATAAEAHHGAPRARTSIRRGRWPRAGRARTTRTARRPRPRRAAQESPWVVTLPLILLAIPSVVIGWFTIEPLLFGGYFGDAIRVAAEHDVLASPRRGVPRPGAVRAARLQGPAVWLARGRRRCWPGSCTSSGRTLAGAAAPEGGRPLHAARQQVLLRRLQREGHRGRQPRARPGALEGRRRRGDRRRGRQRFGAARRLGGRRRPAACSPATSTTMPSRRSSAFRSCSRGSSGEAEQQEHAS